MLIRFFGYVVSFVLVLIVLLLGFICMGCGDSVDTHTCNDDCVMVMSITNGFYKPICKVIHDSRVAKIRK